MGGTVTERGSAVPKKVTGESSNKKNRGRKKKQKKEKREGRKEKLNNRPGSEVTVQEQRRVVAAKKTDFVRSALCRGRGDGEGAWGGNNGLWIRFSQNQEL